MGDCHILMFLKDKTLKNLRQAVVECLPRVHKALDLILSTHTNKLQPKGFFSFLY
jgi:hypothetical protein